MQHQAFPFPHNRLEVFLVSLEMAAQARQVADRIQRGHRSLADQLLRSSGSTVLLIPKGHRFRTRGQGPLNSTISAKAPIATAQAQSGSGTPRPGASAARSPRRPSFSGCCVWPPTLSARCSWTWQAGSRRC